MRHNSLILCVATALLSLTQSVAHAAGVPANVAAAIADSARPADDRKLDENRKPGETLAFAGVKSGGKVAELLPGKGYFTRILSKAVGARGRVFTLAPEKGADAPADRPDFIALAQAVADDPGYGNVTVVKLQKGGVTVPEPVDVFFTAQNYHDLHNYPGLDLEAFNKSVFAALKPGGVYVILDHSAEKGSGARDTQTLHRIDAELVKKEVTAAGFQFVSDSDALANSADSHTTKVFDPSVRGKTDQFILKFRKPGK